MAKVKAVPRKRGGSVQARRRSYEYDHHYGLQVKGRATGKAGRGGGPPGGASPGRAKTKAKRGAKPR